jgi:hypothetical protein
MTDYPDPLHVVVTNAHIGRGKRYSYTDCPLAIAVRAALHDAGIEPGRVTVGGRGGVLIFAGKAWHDARYAPGEDAWKFTDRFDSGLRVKPGEYEFRLIHLRMPS